MKKIVKIFVFMLLIFQISICNSIGGFKVQKSVFNESYGVSVSCDDNEEIVFTNETAIYVIEITNTGEFFDTYMLDCPDLIDCCYWSYLSSYELSLYPCESDIVILTVQPYWELEDTYKITVRATSVHNPSINDSVPTYTSVIIDERTIDTSNDKVIYNSGEPVSLSITNIDNHSIEGTPSFEVYNEFNEMVYCCYPDCWIILEPGEAFFDFWFPNLPQGKYSVIGFFYAYEEEFIDYSYLFILDNNPIDVFTDKNIYQSGEMVNLVMKNECNDTISGNPSFEIYDFNGDMVHEVYIYLWIELGPNETYTEIWWDQLDKNDDQVPDGGYKLIGRLTTSEEEILQDDYRFYIGENLPPGSPGIFGPSNGRVGERYNFTFSLPIDPEGDCVYLRVDWGVGGPGKWHGPYPDGTVKVVFNYTWTRKGNFMIRAQSMDYFNLVSEWSTFKITIPRFKNSSSRTNTEFLENLSNLLPILKLFLTISNK